jgi:hypothetical protein
MQGLTMIKWFAAALLAVAGAGAAAAQQNAGLRIAVISGEDAVNIIQQKTAVAPLVEVRDRNNQPVAGAIVTFSIEGGKAATFGGASTLTVATNAAGQAAVTSLTPSAAGAFQIQVSAAFQGQVATATIAQTNVMTAAQAAAASAASSGGSASGGAGSGAGGAAGGGGGLSTTTIAVAGAAVAGGAVAATQVAKKDDEGGSGPFTGPFTGTTSTTVVSRNSGQNCTITRSISGTITFRSRSNEPTSVSGDLDLNGTATVTATTCVVVNQTNPFGGTLPVSGTQSALRGNASNSSTSSGVSGEVITSNQMLLFDGSMSGNSVTGTLKIEIKAVSTGGGGGPVDSLESGTFSLSLTKS